MLSEMVIILLYFAVIKKRFGSACRTIVQNIYETDDIKKVKTDSEWKQVTYMNNFECLS